MKLKVKDLKQIIMETIEEELYAQGRMTSGREDLSEPLMKLAPQELQTHAANLIKNIKGKYHDDWDTIVDVLTAALSRAKREAGSRPPLGAIKE